MAKLTNNSMSGKLLKLIKPYMAVVEKTNSEQRLSSLLLVGSTAWNIAVTGDDSLKSIVLQTVKTHAEHTELDKILDSLVKRKIKLFSGDKRVILNCKILSMERKKYDIDVKVVSIEGYQKGR